jgi:hypothetical protein
VKASVPPLIFLASKPVIGGPGDVYTLAVGDSAVVQVRAHIPANQTYLRVTQGTRYQFLAPRHQLWIDFFIRATEDGYWRGPIWFIQELFRGLKPLPAKNWFALAGAIDHPTNFPFLIGGETEPISVGASGDLILFANDAKGFYWNNLGSLMVAITRVE